MAGINTQSAKNLQPRLLLLSCQSGWLIGARSSPMSVPVMSYSILDPATPVTARASQCALAVMAKAPRPGTVKTRLSPPLTGEQAAAINVCFLRDTTENIAAVG